MTLYLTAKLEQPATVYKVRRPVLILILMIYFTVLTLVFVEKLTRSIKCYILGRQSLTDLDETPASSMNISYLDRSEKR